MSLLPFSSQLIADVGISLGDEGKGRLIPEVVHELNDTSSPVTTVLKVNGGANSGHTAAGIKLNLLPSGVVEKELAHLAIGAGVVADPRKAWWEAMPLEKKGYTVLARLMIDERTLVSDLTHRLLDLAWEDYRVNVLQEEPRGSTGRGITPAYQDEVGQWQITYADFLGSREAYAKKLAQRAERAVATIQHVCRVSAETFAGFFDKLGAAELRANTREAHLEWLRASGRVQLAGPLLAPPSAAEAADAADAGGVGVGARVGSLLIVSGDDLEQMREWAMDDPYKVAGLFASVTVAPLAQYYVKDQLDLGL